MIDTAVPRRTFLGLIGAAGAQTAIHAVSAPRRPARDDAISLAGEWRFALDVTSCHLHGQPPQVRRFDPKRLMTGLATSKSQFKTRGMRGRLHYV